MNYEIVLLLKRLMKVKIENERETEKFNAVVRRIRIYL